MPLELVERASEPSRERVRDVVVPWDRDDGRPQGVQELGRRRVLLGQPPVREVAAGDDSSGAARSISAARLRLHLGRLTRPDVEVRDVEEAGRESRMSGVHS